MIVTTRLLAALLATFVLAGCGQSGPLYVPGDPSAVEQMPRTPANDEDNEENGENDES